MCDKSTTHLSTRWSFLKRIRSTHMCVYRMEEKRLSASDISPHEEQLDLLIPVLKICPTGKTHGTEPQTTVQHSSPPNNCSPNDDCRNMPTQMSEPAPEPCPPPSQIDTSMSHPHSRSEPTPAASEPAPLRRFTRTSRRPVHLERDYVL